MSGILFSGRVFLSENRERKLVCSLLTDTITQEEFLESEDISTENREMVSTLVARLSLSWPEDTPKTYRGFLGNISKYSSVAGFLQVQSAEPLQVLAAFCHKTLDIRSVATVERQKLVAEELPALWPNLLEILHLEKTDFLPDDVSEFF